MGVLFTCVRYVCTKSSDEVFEAFLKNKNKPLLCFIAHKTPTPSFGLGSKKSAWKMEKECLVYFGQFGLCRKGFQGAKTLNIQAYIRYSLQTLQNIAIECVVSQGFYRPSSLHSRGKEILEQLSKPRFLYGVWKLRPFLLAAEESPRIS